MLSESINQETDVESPGIDDLSRVSNEFIRAASGDVEGGKRAPGLLITTEDIREIYRYVSKSLALPTELGQIRQLLGDYDSGIEGLQPEDVQRLYVSLHAHADSWSELERDMRAVGSDMHVFAGNLISTAQDTVEFIQGLDSWRTLGLDDLTPEQIEQMPPAQLTEGDRKDMPGLLALVDELKVHINAHSASTTRVKDGMGLFKTRLREEIAPAVALKIQLAYAAQESDETTRIRADIALLNERIEQKIAQYEEYCKYRWIGFWWGPLGGAISWSIYGPKAAAVLEEKNRLIEQKNALEAQLRKLNKFLADLQSFETDLQDLKVRINGALRGASEIESLWVLLERLVDSSYRQIDTMEDIRMLVIFVSRFKRVISNWVEIKKHSLDLLTAFDKAISEHQWR